MKAFKKIALFGGTFNPVHFGHINLAISVLEQKELDEVWWIPANISPFRQDEELVLGNHRMEMLKRAVENIPQFSVLDLELKREPPSYTIDTVLELVDDKNSYYLLLADDVFEKFHLWKEAKEIEKKVKLLVGKRHDSGIEIPKMEISATMIRERLKKGLYCGHLLPQNVLDYIYENQLYFTF